SLRRIVLNDEETLLAGRGVFLDPDERFADPFGRRWLVDEGKRAARERMLLVLVEGDDLHRDVTRERVLLQLAENGPAEHVGQEHIERNRGRLELLCKLERIDPARGDQHAEAVVAREIHDDAGIMRIVLDDEKNGIARLNLEP